MEKKDVSTFYPEDLDHLLQDAMGGVLSTDLVPWRGCNRQPNDGPNQNAYGYRCGIQRVDDDVCLCHQGGTDKIRCSKHRI